MKVNTVATAAGSGAGLEEGYYASPKNFEQVMKATAGNTIPLGGTLSSIYILWGGGGGGGQN